MQKYVDVLINELGFRLRAMSIEAVSNELESDELSIIIDKNGERMFDIPKFIIYNRSATSVKNRITPIYIKYNDEYFNNIVECIKRGDLELLKIIGFPNPHADEFEALRENLIEIRYTVTKQDIDKYFKIYNNIIDRKILKNNTKSKEILIYSMFNSSIFVPKNNIMVYHIMAGSKIMIQKIIIEDTKLILIEKVSKIIHDDMVYEEYETEIDIKEVL